MRCFITVPAHLDRLIKDIAADEHRSSKQQLEHWVCAALLHAVKERDRARERDLEEYLEVANAQAQD